MATVIGLRRSPPSVDILIESLEDDDWLVRRRRPICWGRCRRSVGGALMERFAEDKDTGGVKEAGLESPGLIGDARPLELYSKRFRCDRSAFFAMEALAKIKDCGKAPLLPGAVRAVEDRP